MDRRPPIEDTRSIAFELEIGDEVVSFRRAADTRMTFHAAQLVLNGELLVDRATGAELGRLVRIALRDVNHLVVTSGAVRIAGTSLITRCTGPCKRELPLATMGLRHLGGGVLRNQPQCPECRSRYHKRRASK